MSNELNQFNNDLLAKLPNNLSTAIILLDKDLYIRCVNQATEALLLRSKNKLINLNVADIFGNNSIRIADLHKLLASGQEFTNNEITIRIYESETITVELTASAIEINNAEFILLELKQIDKQKQINSESFQKQQLIVAKDLIKGLAHEIKNPLGGIKGAAQLLERELPKEQREFTQIIVEQTDRLTNLVDRLLGPNQLPKMSEHNIHEVLEQIIKLVNFYNPKNIHLIRDYDPSIPCTIFDPDKLQQAILNIVNNAMQVLNKDEQITLKTRIASKQTINGELHKMAIEISIIDNGMGIPKEIQETLFYPMVSGRENGTGLGLSISQTLILQHNGKISCNSRQGLTEFIILLPLTATK